MNANIRTNQVTDDMVVRFLGWRVPQHFYPDCYISFDREKASQSPNSWPTGTNLLDAYQARKMLEHVLQPRNETSGLTFGLAIEALKNGQRVARSGWNGKDMWLGLVLAYDYNPNSSSGVASAHALGFVKLPWIGMKTADDKFVPWLASQSDMLADDWLIVGAKD
jgi:hypothetical protein